MFKETVISIIIIIFIISLDFITQNYTKETVENTTDMLNELKKQVENDTEEVSDGLEDVFRKWEERRKILAYFIEHDELEKVETNLTNIKSFINRKEKNLAISGIDEANFILKHIKEKNAFNLENIF